MEPQLPAEVREFGRAAAEMLQRRGGFALARQAQRGTDAHGAVAPGDAPPAPGDAARAPGDADPRDAAGELLAAIDADGLDPRATVEEALAAAELCRAAGAVALPYPLAQQLSRRDGERFAIVAALDDAPLIVDHADRVESVVALDGRRAPIGARDPLGGALSRFAAVVSVAPDAAADADPLASGALATASPDVPLADVALQLDLQAAYVVGALEAAVALTVAHTSQRRQFGRPLSSFQALRFQVVEASLACRGTVQLLRFTLWRLHAAPADALADALALRLQMQEAAKRTLAIAHQLHGAMGFANEHDLPFLTRAVQPVLRLPLDYEATTDALLQRVDVTGFETLYGRFTPGVVGAPASITPV